MQRWGVPRWHFESPGSPVSTVPRRCALDLVATSAGMVEAAGMVETGMVEAGGMVEAAGVDGTGGVIEAAGMVEAAGVDGTVLAGEASFESVSK